MKRSSGAASRQQNRAKEKEVRPHPAFTETCYSASSAPPEFICCADGVLRPQWASRDPLLIDYYDHEWGEPVLMEQPLFEIMSLLVFQAGLRWRSILARRTALRAAFCGFSPDLVALFDQDAVAALLVDKRIIRNRRKICSVITNARAVLTVRRQVSLPEIIWGRKPARNPPYDPIRGFPEMIPEAIALAQDLRDAGFVSIGNKTSYALMQAIGVVNANPPTAYKTSAVDGRNLLALSLDGSGRESTNYVLLKEQEQSEDRDGGQECSRRELTPVGVQLAGHPRIETNC